MPSGIDAFLAELDLERSGPEPFNGARPRERAGEPDLFGDDALVFPNEAGELLDTYGHFLPTESTGCAEAPTGDPGRPL